jgi:tetratricopeptide (TPR) repeat protein
MVAQNPDDSRTRYMLAMELSKSGDLNGAVEQYQAILEREPDYVPAYFHCGQTLERLGKTDEAQQTYKEGIEVCARNGDQKTKGELEEALSALS